MDSPILSSGSDQGGKRSSSKRSWAWSDGKTRPGKGVGHESYHPQRRFQPLVVRPTAARLGMGFRPADGLSRPIQPDRTACETKPEERQRRGGPPPQDDFQGPTAAHRGLCMLCRGQLLLKRYREQSQDRQGRRSGRAGRGPRGAWKIFRWIRSI